MWPAFLRGERPVQSLRLGALNSNTMRMHSDARVHMHYRSLRHAVSHLCASCEQSVCCDEPRAATAFCIAIFDGGQTKHQLVLRDAPQERELVTSRQESIECERVHDESRVLHKVEVFAALLERRVQLHATQRLHCACRGTTRSAMLAVRQAGGDTPGAEGWQVNLLVEHAAGCRTALHVCHEHRAQGGMTFETASMLVAVGGVR